MINVHKSFISPKDSLQAAWDSFEPEMVRSNSKNGKKRFEAVLEARVIWLSNIFFSEWKISLEIEYEGI